MKTTSTEKRLPTAVRAEAQALGLIIRGARLKRRWTQKNLAERAGISITTLQRLESGNTAISFAAVCMVCWLLDIAWKINLPLGMAEYFTAIAHDKQRARLPFVERLDDNF